MYVTLAPSNLQLVLLDYGYLLCCKTNIHVPDTALHQHLYDCAMHYEFKLERQSRSLFQVKIKLAGLTVKSKATELNSEVPKVLDSLVKSKELRCP